MSDFSNPEEAANALVQLVLYGWLVGVKVFGTDECCEHGVAADCDSTGFGLCDRFGPHTPGGSDCNRAEHFLMRPADRLMTEELRRLVLAEEADHP